MNKDLLFGESFLAYSLVAIFFIVILNISLETHPEDFILSYIILLIALNVLLYQVVKQAPLHKDKNKFKIITMYIITSIVSVVGFNLYTNNTDYLSTFGLIIILTIFMFNFVILHFDTYKEKLKGD